MFLDLLHSDVCCAPRDSCVPTGGDVFLLILMLLKIPGF